MSLRLSVTSQNMKILKNGEILGKKRIKQTDIFVLIILCYSNFFRYWTQQCDEMMKRYLNFLKSLWNEYADSRKMEKIGVNTSQKTMGLVEFRDMANDFNLKDTNLTEREVIMSFNLALMTEIDEITSDRYMVLSFVEFLESIARLAEFKSRTPVGEREESYIPGETLEIRLEYKIESLLELMSISFESVIKDRKRR